MTGPVAQPIPALKTWNTIGKYSRIDPDPKARAGGESIFTDGTRIFVQAEPAKSAGGEMTVKTFEEHDPRLRRCIRSFRTPIHAFGGSWSDSTLAVLRREPEPTITFWRTVKAIDWDAAARPSR